MGNDRNSLLYTHLMAYEARHPLVACIILPFGAAGLSLERG